MVTTMHKQSNTKIIRNRNSWNKDRNEMTTKTRDMLVTQSRIYLAIILPFPYGRKKTCSEIFTMLISQEIEHVTIGAIQ
jgi:hypothetical protein